MKRYAKFVCARVTARFTHVKLNILKIEGPNINENTKKKNTIKDMMQRAWMTHTKKDAKSDPNLEKSRVAKQGRKT